MSSSNFKVDGILGMLTIKLKDDNFAKWAFQFQSVLRGYKLFGHFDGTTVCPSKYVVSIEVGVTKEISEVFVNWESTDMALLSLLLATLSDEAMEYVLGCRTAHEAWINLVDRYASVSKSRVNHLKTELHTIQKGTDTIDKYLLRLKSIRDQLTAAGESISDNDIIIAGLAGLPKEYGVIRTVILARESSITLKEFRAQLLGVEREIDGEITVLSQSLSTMYVQGSTSGSNGASSSNAQTHNHIPGNTGGIITAGSYGSTPPISESSLNNSLIQPNFQQPVYSAPPQQFQQPFYSAPPLQPIMFPGQPYGYGFVGNSTEQNNSATQFNGGFQFWARGQSSNQYRGNNYRNNNTFRGRGYGSSNSRQSGHNSWSGNTNTRSNVVIECQICNKRGHTAVNCYQRNSNSSNSSFVIECQICGKRGHLALDCYQMNNYSFQGQSPPTSLSAMNAQQAPQFSPQDNWIVDSGASHHMTADINALTQVTPFEGSDKIIIGNGTGLSIHNIGSATIQTNNHSLLLNKILHVPRIARNLLSVKQLCADNKSWFICDESQFFVQDKRTREIVYHGKSKPEELFHIPVVPQKRGVQVSSSNPAAYLGKAIKSEVWHQRLGHPTQEIMSSMLQKSKISGYIDDKHTICVPCIQGKMSRTPFPVRSNTCTFPFEKIHSDTWGPSPVKSLEGYRYYVTLIDEYTRYVWIFPMSNKSDVFTIFVRFYNFVLTQFGKHIKSLQTDGGGEYVSHRFTSFLAQKGIVQCISCPYTPQQNGMAERKHRHIVETAITLLNTAGLTPEFWYFACAHSVFLINRMPCKTLLMCSPYQCLYQKVPDVQSLKIFGSAMFPWLRPYNANKLQARSAMCIFLGYFMGYKGVICFDLKTRKYIISRHVIFDESCFPAKLPQQHTVIDQHQQASQQFMPVLIPVPDRHRGLISSTQLPDLVTSDTSGHNQPCTSEQGNVSISGSQDSDTVSSDHLTLSTPVDTPHLLPVLDPAQLQVVLPFTTSSSSNNSDPNDVRPNGPQTRLQTGAISRQNYASFITSLPQLLSLQLMDSASEIQHMEQCHGGFSFLADISDVEEPKNFKSAVHKVQWQKAMQEEFDALKAQGTWKLVPPPSNQSVIGSKWVYKVKKNPDGSVSRFKARLVAQGFTQEHGIDYSETFSPVVRHTTVRIILALAAQFSWPLRQLDIKNAFLHGDLEEEVYMTQPQGFVDPQQPDHVCRLVKSLYGLKQAPRAWNSKFTSYLPSLGFTTSLSDTSLFVKVDDADIILLLLYVDDIILTGSNPTKVQYVINDLAGVFDLTDMGKLTYFLGIQVQYHTDGSLFLNQSKYAKELLKKAGMESCKPTSTPFKPHTQVLANEGVLLTDPSQYRSVVGAFQYLTFTRPDLAYSVNMVCQYMTQPTDVHLHLVKRILRYVQGTVHCGLHYTKGSDFKLTAYSDSDWAADITTRRSISGFVVYLGSNPISWQSKKQSTVSRSSTEAEYKALAHCAADVFWIRSVFKDIHQHLSTPHSLYCDNLSALALSSNPVFHSKIKHLDTDYHFVREKVQKGAIHVHYIPTDDQVADVFTKGLHSPLFLKHCRHLGLGVLSSLQQTKLNSSMLSLRGE
ncbi:hypothetical protein COP2_017588 [Malus domestica]